MIPLARTHVKSDNPSAKFKRISERFPLESLEFLNLVAAGTSFLAFAQELLDCLDAIRQARPEAVTDQRFQSLVASIRQRGGA